MGGVGRSVSILSSASGGAPHMWGKDVQARCSVLLHRWSPGRVGGTVWAVRGDAAFWGGAPGMRGKCISVGRLKRRCGGSPSVRGGATRYGSRRLHPRWNPVCVGKRYRRAASWRRPRVEPRTCGERSTRRFDLGSFLGGSPNAWGKAWRKRLLPVRRGRIPCARGERWRRSLRLALRYGGSPCSWGKATLPLIMRASRGWIPVLVGKGLASATLMSCAKVDPRARGERASDENTVFVMF